MRQLRGLTVLDQATGETTELRADHVVLALGHSARDTFEMLHERGVFMEAKPFSIGFRIEHPQGVIDRARWGRHAGHPLLGAADYKLVHHAANGRSVYSFCMCPGGTVVAATSRAAARGHQRHEPVLAQRAQRQRGHGRGHRPARLPGRAAGRHRAAAPAGIAAPSCSAAATTTRRASWSATSSPAGRPPQLGGVEPSYKPGVTLGDLHGALPDYAIAALREALPAFGRKIKGFDMPDAVLTGVETRTSSPLRITRGEDFQSLNTRGLYPAGEGAGYAGGILSAGVDGIKVAEAVAKSHVALSLWERVSGEGAASPCPSPPPSPRGGRE